ncbi:MAG: DUF4124 domain-containing protein [Granulosicoccaceae bacterium]
MFWRLCVKLLFKATFPLLMLLGVLNYAVYLKGGDPLAMWNKLGDNMLASFQSNASTTVAKVKAIGDVDWDLSDGALANSAAGTEIFAWRDQDGTMHYSSSKPIGIEAERQSYNTNTNVVQRFKAPEKPKKAVKPEETDAVGQPPSIEEQTEGLSLPKSLSDLPVINGVDPAQIEATIKKRQEMLDKL